MSGRVLDCKELQAKLPILYRIFGFELRTTSSYRSTVSVFHQRIEAASVGEYPSVSILIKRLFHGRISHPLLLLSFGT